MQSVSHHYKTHYIFTRLQSRLYVVGVAVVWQLGNIHMHLSTRKCFQLNIIGVLINSNTNAVHYFFLHLSRLSLPAITSLRRICADPRAAGMMAP